MQSSEFRGIKKILPFLQHHQKTDTGGSDFLFAFLIEIFLSIVSKTEDGSITRKYKLGKPAYGCDFSPIQEFVFIEIEIEK